MSTHQGILQEEKDFINSARTAQAKRGRRLWGRTGLSKDQYSAIEEALQNLSLKGEFNKVGGHDAVKTLLTRFEELCRRNQRTIPDEQRNKVSSILARELFINGATFFENVTEKELEQLVPLTLYNGDSLSGIHHDPEFTSLQDTPSIFKRAVISYPSDPREFLRDVKTTLESLQQDNTLTIFRDNKPGAFKRAALSYPSGPQEFLENVIKGTASLKEVRKWFPG